MLNDLKSFIFKGNILDLAIGVIVAGAFGSIISSFTDDIIMPPLGLLIGGVDFGDLKLVLKSAEGDVPEVAINYGKWINTVINFLILSVILYYVMQVYKKINPPAPEALAAPAGPTQEELLTQIRDLLKNK
jgi:large conductance mechanosensitive channel